MSRGSIEAKLQCYLAKRLAPGAGEVAQRFLEERLERFNCVVTIRSIRNT